MRRMRLTAAVSVVAVGAAVTALAGPAGAATSAATPATGLATSGLTVAQLAVGSATVAVGRVALSASTLTSKAASVSVIPAVVNGTSVGAVAVTPSNSPQTVGGGTRGLAVGPLSATLTAPSATAAASNAPSASLDANGLGATLLSLPLNVVGLAAHAGSSVSTTLASAGKTVSLSSIALPTLSALLAKLGLDASALSNLPLSGLQSLATTVGQVVTSAQSGLSTASGAVTSANTSYLAAQTNLATAATNLMTQINAVPSTAWTTLGVTAPTTPQAFYALGSTVISTLESTDTALHTADQAYQSALTAVNTALNALKSAISALVADILAALDKPLLGLGNVNVTTTAKAGSALVADATATVGSVNVLGLASTVTGLVSTLQNTVGRVFATLHAVVPAVNLQLPTVTLASITKSTGVDNGVQNAAVTVTPLAITLPAESVDLSGVTNGLPAAPLSLVRIASPAAVAHAGIATPAVSLSLASVDESSQFRPATAAPATSTPATSTPAAAPASAPGQALPRTGGTLALPLAALVILGVALTLRRRQSH